MSITLDSLNTQILALRSEVTALSAALSAAPKASKPRAKKAAAEKDPDAPKKEATWWIKATQEVRAALKSTMDAHNANLAEGAKKLPGTAPVQVSRILKEAGLLSADRMPEEAEIMTAFQTFLTAPLAVKTAEWKAAASPAGSTASATSAGSKPKAAKEPLSEEEAAAAKAAKAAKAKATRERNAAAKAAAAAAPPPVAAPESSEDSVVEAYEWKHDIGKGLKTYERIDFEGKAYIYTADGDAYIGVWDGKAIDKKIPDFQAE
jgi:hypothetical protein